MLFLQNSIMNLKLGGKLELKDLEVPTSTLEARKLFLELIWEMKPEVVLDLLRLFNLNSVPAEEIKTHEQKNFFNKLPRSKLTGY